MGRTSISCSDEAMAAVEERKREDETWDGCLLRLSAGVSEPSDSDEIATKLASLEAALESLETTVESNGRSGDSTTADVNAIREAVREEVRNQIQDLLR